MNHDLLALALLLATPAFAQSFVTWDGGGDGASFESSANWLQFDTFGPPPDGTFASGNVKTSYLHQCRVDLLAAGRSATTNDRFDFTIDSLTSAELVQVDFGDGLENADSFFEATITLRRLSFLARSSNFPICQP